MEIEDGDYKVLYDRVIQMRMQELFSEPYDGDMENEEEDEWENLFGLYFTMITHCFLFVFYWQWLPFME